MTERSVIMMISKSNIFFFSFLTVCAASCTQGQKREESKSNASAEANPVTETGDETVDTSDKEENEETETTGNVEGGETVASGPGQTLEDCAKESKAWRAVVNSGKSPASCSTETLVDWCCTREEVLARFPSIADKLKVKFDQYVDKEKLKLYNCSKDGDKTTFHFALISGASTTYKTTFVTGIAPFETGHDNKSCVAVTTADLGGIIPAADTDSDATDSDATDSDATDSDATDAGSSDGSVTEGATTDATDADTSSDAGGSGEAATGAGIRGD
jgi:hypothetical protein